MKIEYKRPKATATFTDENGYFSFTGTVSGASGAVGENIVKMYPEFASLNDLHLIDCKTGRPMHAWENAAYHLLNPSYSAEEMLKSSRGSLGASEELFERFLKLVYAEPTVRDTPLYTEGWKKSCNTLREELKDYWRQQIENVPEMLKCIAVDTTTDSDSYDFDENPEGYADNILALALHLYCSPEDVEATGYDSNTLEAEGKEFLVVDDYEGNRLWDKYLENLLEEIIYPDLAENMRIYFDDELWKSNARIDGRGHSLNGYDGTEREQEVNGETYYIYRQS